jgi:hypothetical protein
MYKERPSDILKSIKNGNTEHLRAAGRKGAEVANKNREREKTIAEISAELAEEEKLLRAKQMLDGAEEARLQRGGDPED